MKKDVRNIKRYSNETIQHLVNIAIHLSFFMVILVPIIALTYVTRQMVKLIILGISVLIAAVISTSWASTLHKPGLGIIAA